MVGVLWLVAVVLLAFGSAGIVAGMAHLPGTPSRAELTWTGDEALRPELDAAAADLATIATDVETLADRGRAALSAMVSRDESALSAISDEGALLAASIAASSDALRVRVGALPGLAPDAALRYSGDLLGRRAVLLDALDATQGLSGAWAQLVAGILSATKLTALLEGHDLQTASGAELGRSTRYDEAVAALDVSLGMLGSATELRDSLAATVDVTILDEWIGRNRTYDEALRTLYTLLGTSQGRVTPAIREAYAAEEAARANLPPDTRGLVVIMAEIGRGGLNQAVIKIERARGRLALALEDAAAPTSP